VEFAASARQRWAWFAPSKFETRRPISKEPNIFETHVLSMAFKEEKSLDAASHIEAILKTYA
jgi:hypothetical protein